MHLFTSDIDWAPEEVISDTIELFSKYGVKCTFFCTHRSSVIQSIEKDFNFELGIHPNFLPVMNERIGTMTGVIENMLEIIPNPKGVRSHSLVQSSRLSIMFKNYGLKYQANTHLPYMKEITPFKLWNGLFEVMHNFEDDIHFLYKHSFDNPGLELFTQNLNVFNFHPIHIFLNTDCEKTFSNSRVYYNDPKELRRMRNIKKIGTRDLLVRLLKDHNRIFKKTLTVAEYLNV